LQGIAAHGVRATQHAVTRFIALGSLKGDFRKKYPIACQAATTKPPPEGAELPKPLAPMNVDRLLEDLRAQRDQLDQAITLLEDLLVSTRTARRGRRTMSPAERAVVSQRMKEKWAKRRAQRDA
jgi:hypothetical protein